MKQHKMIASWAVAGLVLLTTACQKETISPYEGSENQVYFQTQASWTNAGYVTYTTFTQYSFAEKPDNVKSIVLRGHVQLLGNVADHDRKITVTVDAARTTMKEGEGFQLDADTFRIKAGENSAAVDVRLLRTAALRTKNDTLTLQLQPNDDFTVLQTYKANNDWSNTSAGSIDGTRYTFVVGEVYTRPSSWSGGGPLYVNNYFGEWTITRYLFINQFFGFVGDDWIYVNGATSKLAAGRMDYYARQLQKELQRRADEGDPVKDEDGSYMQLPDAYRVDYSKYTTN